MDSYHSISKTVVTTHKENPTESSEEISDSKETVPKLQNQVNSQNLEVDAKEIDKLFDIVVESDASLLNEIMRCEQVFTQRRFAPYPVHQQLYMQQQHEQERRRQSMMISSSRSAPTSRDSCDIFKTPNGKYTEAFRSKIVRKIIGFIDSYSIKTFTTQKHNSEKCVVCMYNFQENEGLRVLLCSHKFHRKCVDEWLVKSYMCPVCRTDLMQSGKTYRGLAVLYHNSLLRLNGSDSGPSSSNAAST